MQAYIELSKSIASLELKKHNSEIELKTETFRPSWWTLKLMRKAKEAQLRNEARVRLELEQRSRDDNEKRTG